MGFAIASKKIFSNSHFFPLFFAGSGSEEICDEDMVFSAWRLARNRLLTMMVRFSLPIPLSLFLPETRTGGTVALRLRLIICQVGHGRFLSPFLDSGLSKQPPQSLSSFFFLLPPPPLFPPFSFAKGRKQNYLKATGTGGDIQDVATQASFFAPPFPSPFPLFPLLGGRREGSRP